jgi:hypothetical protein
VLALPSFGIDLRHEKRARPRRSRPPATGHSCPLEEDPPHSELDFPEESDPLSPSEDSQLDSAQHGDGDDAAVAATCSFRRLSSSCISRARSSAVKAHLRALGLTGVVLENKKVQLPVGAPKRVVPLGEVTAVVEQKGTLDGMLIGGGMLCRFTEREPDPDDVQLAGVARVGIIVPVEDGAPVGEALPEAEEVFVVDETVRLSRGPRRVCAGLVRVVPEGGVVGARATAIGPLPTGTGLTTNGAGVRRGRSES